MWRVLVVCGVAGCAGDLDQPERFDFLIRPDGTAGTGDGDGDTTVGDGDGDTAMGDGDGDVAMGDGDVGDGDSSSAALPACLSDLFETRCGSPGCHSAGATPLDLVSPGVEGRLVDQPSSTQFSCSGRSYISTDGSGSLLLEKLRPEVPCGLPMPLTGGPLDATERECLDSWVESIGGDLDPGDGA